jgi:hypothetical protein
MPCKSAVLRIGNNACVPVLTPLAGKHIGPLANQVLHANHPNSLLSNSLSKSAGELL